MMSLSSYGLLIFLLLVIFSVSFFGSLAGYTVNGVPLGGSLSTEAPGIFGIIEWVWDSLEFLYNMMSFQIDGMPIYINMVFLGLSLLTSYLVLRLIRGVS